MRLRRKNSLQASKLPRSLRSLALRSHEGPPASDSPETLTKRGKISRVSERSIHKIASPRVHDEREEGEDFVANRRMTRAMDGEEPNKLVSLDSLRSMRREDCGGKKHQNKGIQGKFMNRALKKAGRKSRNLPASLPADRRDIENTPYRKKLRYQEQNSAENGDNKHRGIAADDPQFLKNDTYKLKRFDMAEKNGGNGAFDSLDDLSEYSSIQDPKKLRQARAVLKSLQRQQRVPLQGGVTTRHKTSLTTQAQPVLPVDREDETPQSPKPKHLKKNITGSGLCDSPALRNTHNAKLQTSNELPTEGKKKKGRPPRNDTIVSTPPLNNARVLTRTGRTQQEGSFQKNEDRRQVTKQKGTSERDAQKTGHSGDTQLAYTAVDSAHSPKCKLKKRGRGGSNGSSLPCHWKRRRTLDRLGNSGQINTNEASYYPTGSPHKASEEELHITARDSKDSVVTPRRSKRKRNTGGLNVLNGHKGTSQMHLSSPKGTKSLESIQQVRGQTGDVAIQDAFCRKGSNSSIEHLEGNDIVKEKGQSTSKATANEVGPIVDVLKMEPLSKCCLVATNPIETGGRQMRPRPLDLEQPLLVLVEGSNKDYYEFDGGSFYWMLQQQPESKNPFINKVKSNGSYRRTADVLDATGDKAEPILIPSFRPWMEPDGMQSSDPPYVLPESYIKTSSETKSLQAEYDMDDEDEEWLSNYNQSVSPASTLSADQFEKIVDLLENKVTDLNGYNSITEAFEEGQEPPTEECCICNGGENSDDNLVYECASCHILVHQSCYGIQKGGRNVKRKRNWNCRKCEAVAEGQETADLSCALCCKQGGALKPTTELHRWAHVVCALYTNETYFMNPDAMEPIDGLVAADARAKRQKRQCWLCGVREGSVERCCMPGCKALFHVSCGVTQGASFELQHSNHQVTSVRVYCPKHALSALGVQKAKPEEPGDKENQIEEEENQNLIGKKSVDSEELYPVLQEIPSHDQWTRKQRKRKSLSEGRASGQGVSDRYGKDQAGRTEDGCLFDSRTEQECTSKSFKGEKTSELAKKGRRISEGMSGEKACAELTIDDMLGQANANPGLMEGVYLYWVLKRSRQGGALLHHIQQERAARQFNIFNSDDDEPSRVPVSEERLFRPSDIDMKVVAAREQLQILQKLTLLVVRRERLKLDIFLLEQNILKISLAALGTSPQCLICEENHLSLVCTVCNRSTCLHSLLSRSGSRCKSWLDYLKRPEYVCSDCEKDSGWMCGEMACIPSVDRENDCLAGCSITPALKKVFGCDKILENSSNSSYKRPLILLPSSDVIQQDKLAMEVFWGQTQHKMVFLSDVLKKPL